MASRLGREGRPVSLHQRLLDATASVWVVGETVPPAAKLNALSAALRAVAELHSAFHYEWFGIDCCSECSDPDGGLAVHAPCETVRVIARELGIEADHA